MIVYPELIKWGRLGNQLFEMAATISLAVDNKDTFGFNRRWNGIEWLYFGRFPIGREYFHDHIPPGPEYRERLFTYVPIPYQPDLRLFGYFFAEKYFAHNQALIRSLLTPLGVPPTKRKTCSVHVRRGDYVYLQDQHPVLSMHYYERATNMMAQQFGIERFMVFSDDPKWCAGMFGSNFEIVHDGSDTDHLSKMVSCDHHIVANSTFSWWGAWLCPESDKKVIYPSKYYGPAYSHDTKDLWPKDWIKVEV